MCFLTKIQVYIFLKITLGCYNNDVRARFVLNVSLYPQNIGEGQSTCLVNFGESPTSWKGGKSPIFALKGCLHSLPEVVFVSKNSSLVYRGVKGWQLTPSFSSDEG